MKKILLFTAILFLITTTFCKALPLKPVTISTDKRQKDPLIDYTGKFKIDLKKGPAVLEIAIVNGELVATQLWDGEKVLLKHLSGDSFMVAGFDWSAKFLRGKDKKVTEILVMGTDHWMKIKE
ncbi:hypothetical protein [Mucilaginibacter sp. OK098]|uniref:hypothetical protein n=1 Tax=Mucilaginibacter sp. OK098 TaxID=1855297 RepID=UPI0009153357|nr:hypothetical protein [Mucilaginibacter sp. OK098]SHM02146.1 hypothetical protein SAMN05216524_101548 [Mucilaginibacter sp. OK098]